jgi:hypothetical protein
MSKSLPFRTKSIRFEFGAWQARLTNNGAQCADSKFAVVGHGNRNRRSTGEPLHDDVASCLANSLKTVALKSCARLTSGEDSQFTQCSPQND